LICLHVFLQTTIIDYLFVEKDIYRHKIALKD